MHQVNVYYYLSHSYSIAWDRLWNCFCARLCVCLSALSQSHFLLDFHEKWHRGKKSSKSENEFVGVNIGPPLPYYAPKIAPKEVRIGIYQPNHKIRKIAMSRSHQTGSLRQWQRRYNMSQTSSVVQNWRITNPRWRTAAILEIHKQAYLSQFFTYLHRIWCAASYWS